LQTRTRLSIDKFKGCATTELKVNKLHIPKLAGRVIVAVLLILEPGLCILLIPWTCSLAKRNNMSQLGIVPHRVEPKETVPSTGSHPEPQPRKTVPKRRTLTAQGSRLSTAENQMMRDASTTS